MLTIADSEPSKDRLVLKSKAKKKHVSVCSLCEKELPDKFIGTTCDGCKSVQQQLPSPQMINFMAMIKNTLSDTFVTKQDL